MARRKRSSAVIQPNLGLYLDRPLVEIPERGLAACNNVRILNGKLTNQGIGWEKFLTTALNGPVTLIDNFFLRSGGQVLVFGTPTDLYQYHENDETVSYITPVYVTGTVAVTNGSATVTGTGTAWDTALKAGDEIYIGADDQTDPTATWYVVDTVDSDTQITLTETYAGATDTGLDYTARLLFTGDAQDYWRTETFPKALPDDEDQWFATNGVDYGVYWNGIDDHASSLSDFGFRFKELVRYKNMMLYANLVIDGGEARPFSMRNSAIGQPHNVTTEEAAENVITEGLADIVGLFPLADTMIAYTQRDITMIQFVGAPLVFAFRTVVSGIGALTGRLIADFGDFHEFIGPDAAYRFAGVDVEEIGYQVWREILRKQDPGRIGLGLSHFDEERGILLWAIPLTTDTASNQNQTAYLEHYLEDIGPTTPVPYTQQDWPVTATGFFERLNTLTFDQIADTWAEQSYRWNDRFYRAAFPFNLFGSADGNVYTLATSDSFDGEDIESWARFGRRPASDERHRAVVMRIYAFADQMPGANYGLGVLLWVTDQLAGELTLAGQYDFDLTHEGRRFVSPRKAGRFLQVEFATTGVNRVWTLHGYDLDLVPVGER